MDGKANFKKQKNIQYHSNVSEVFQRHLLVRLLIPSSGLVFPIHLIQSVELKFN